MAWDAAIVGGGPAGAATAIRLAEAGRCVRLIEREQEPHHKVCGEFLSANALAELRRLGADPEALGAVPIGRLRLIQGRRVAETDLPFAAAGLSRLRLDSWALDRAAEAGAIVTRGVGARSVLTGIDARQVHLMDGERVEAGSVVVATGKHSLRGQKRSGHPPSDLIGLKMHLRLAPGQRAALDGHVELLLFRGGYAGLQPVEGGLANLCLLVAKSSFERAGRDWGRLIARIADEAPLWKARLAEAEPCWPRPLAVYGLPYGFLVGATDDIFYRVGDQAAVIPSFAGDGLAIALHTARCAASAIAEGRGPAAHHAELARQLRPQIRAAVWLRHLLERPFGQRVAAAAGQFAPSLLQATARRLRVPDMAAV